MADNHEIKFTVVLQSLRPFDEEERRQAAEAIHWGVMVADLNRGLLYKPDYSVLEVVVTPDTQ